MLPFSLKHDVLHYFRDGIFEALLTYKEEYSHVGENSGNTELKN